MKVTTTTFEGTPEEYQEYYATHEGGPKPNTSTVDRTVPMGGGESDYAQFIQRVLRRMPIPRGQHELYRVLCAAGDEFLSSPEIATRIGRTDREMSGVLGALGKRINRTPGSQQVRDEFTKRGEALAQSYPIFLLLETQQSPDGVRCFHLRSDVRRVLEEEGVVEK